MPEKARKEPKPKRDVIALVGAGHGGQEILSTLLRMPGIEVGYVVDVDKTAPAIVLARDKKIPHRSDGSLAGLQDNAKIDLIIEVTGHKEVFRRIRDIKHEHTAIISATGMRIIWHLMEMQREASGRLEAYKDKLEQRIIERTEEIERANRSLEGKILEYERLNQELLKVNEEKTGYLLRATHHLKAPFAAIQSYTDIILEGYAGEIEDGTRDIVNKIRIRCEMLSEAIKDMLELANLRITDRDHVLMSVVSLNEILIDAVEAHKVIAHSRKIGLLFEPLPGNDNVYGHAGQIRSLFGALIENAVNYSHNDSTVEIVSAPAGEGKVTIVVRDFGIGISEGNQAKIFGDYYRTNEAVRKCENGTGLGLAIVREVSKLHNFTVRVESDVDEGCTFSITIPLETG